MRRHARADCWPSVIGPAPGALARPAFLGDPAGREPREPRARRDCTGAASALHIRPIDMVSCALDLSTSCCSAAVLVRSAW